MSEGMVNCPGCKAEYDGSGYDPGDRFQCPECNTIVTIPGGAPAAAAAPAKAASRGNTHRAARGGTGRTSRPPAARGGTSKMRVVNEAVGMGALDPNADMRAIRRASQPAPEVQDNSGDKMVLYGGVGVVALAIIGLVIYIAKQPSAEEKKKANVAKKAAAEAKEKEEAATKTSEKPPERPRPPADAGWDADPAIDAEVITTLAILKSHSVDESFWKTASKLLRHGRAVIPCLVQKWSGDSDVANASRLIVDRAVKGGPALPEGLFDSPASRAAMIMEYRHWWVNEPKGQAAQLVSEAEFGGGGGAEIPPTPGNPPSNPPANPPGGVTEIKKTGGGVSEGAMRRDLPQHLSNYARGTFEQREQATAEIRKYGKIVIPALINALKEDDVAMANAANDLLKIFTKQDQGKVPGEPGDRPPFIEKWQSWWKGAEATFVM